MTHRFVLYWINKNHDCSAYSPEQLDETINVYTKWIYNNITEQSIKDCWEDYSKLENSLVDIHKTFWSYNSDEET